VSWENEVSRYRSLLETQFHRQDDGTYLLRPYWILPIVYEVDAVTKERWARHHIGLWRYKTIAVFGLACLALLHQEPWDLFGYVFDAIAIAYALGVVFERIWLHATILRTAQRVRANRWTGPIRVDPLKLGSRRAWAWGMAFFAISTVTLALVEGLSVGLALDDPSVVSRKYLYIPSGDGYDFGHAKHKSGDQVAGG
jgi:hypothetical protein